MSKTYYHKLFATALLLLMIPAMSDAKDFLNDERYHGWFWFEEKKHAKDHTPTSSILNNNTTKDPNITPEEAKAEIEQFARELEDLKFMMLARPTPENVKTYRDKEKIMWTNAENLHDAFDMANLLYPDQRDLISNPSNVHAIKARREITAIEDASRIKLLAKQFDLVLFFSSTCPTCKLLSPVLKRFCENYGFNIEAINHDSTATHEYFKTANAPKLIAELGITSYPTVIAISKDSKTAFELIRGFVSISELEEYSLLAIKYLKTQGKWQEI